MVKRKKEFIEEITRMVDTGEYLKIVPFVEEYIERVDKESHMTASKKDGLNKGLLKFWYILDKDSRIP